MVGGWCCGDDGWAVSTSPIGGSSGGIVWSTKGGACAGSGGLEVACSGADIRPRWCWICLRMTVCWAWVVIICSWWARRVVICWVRMLWEVPNAWKVWHRPLYSIMGIAILGSAEGDGSDVGGITGGVCDVAWGAEGATFGIGSIGATVGAGGWVSAGMSTGSSGSSRCSGPAGAPWSTPP